MRARCEGEPSRRNCSGGIVPSVVAFRDRNGTPREAKLCSLVLSTTTAYIYPQPVNNVHRLWIPGHPETTEHQEGIAVAKAPHHNVTLVPCEGMQIVVDVEFLRELIAGSNHQVEGGDPPPDVSPLDIHRTNRKTGSEITLTGPYEDDPAKWHLVCETHQRAVAHPNKAVANRLLASPWAWCSGCKRKVGGGAPTPGLRTEDIPRPHRTAA